MDVKEEAGKLTQEHRRLLAAIRDATVLAKDPNNKNALWHWMLAYWLTELLCLRQRHHVRFQLHSLS